MIDRRAGVLGARTRVVEDAAFDEYLPVRDAYLAAQAAWMDWCRRSRSAPAADAA